MIKYREIHGYKYLLEELYVIDTGILGQHTSVYAERFVRLHKDGRMTISEGYAWDGPSGPTIDTPSFIRASLVHDALYQLIREGVLDVKHRKKADKLMRQICKEDGMPFWRRWYTYNSVRLFGGMHVG